MVVEAATKGLVLVIEAIAMAGSETVEMISFVTKLLLVAYGVVWSLQLLATHWHLLVKLMLLLGGRNPEANVARELSLPFPAEVLARARELKKFGVPVVVPTDDAGWLRFQVQGAKEKSYVVRVPKDEGKVNQSSCACMSYIQKGKPCKHRVALQAASLGVPVKLAAGRPLSAEYETAGRGRMLSGILGICHTKGVLLWRGVGSNQTLELLTGSANFTTSSRANQEWSFRLLLAPNSPQQEAVGQWAEALEQGCITLDAARLQSAASVRARSASPGN